MTFWPANSLWGARQVVTSVEHILHRQDPVEWAEDSEGPNTTYHISIPQYNLPGGDHYLYYSDSSLVINQDLYRHLGKYLQVANKRMDLIHL